MRSAFEKPCTGTSRRSRRETGSFTFRLARHECYCQRVPSAAGRASRTSVGSERRLRVGSASSWAPDAVVRPRTCADRRSACANDRCRHHQLSPRRERRSRSKVDLSLAEKTAAGCNGSAATVRRQWEQSLTQHRPRLANPPMRPAAVERQVRRYSGQPPYGLANVRYGRPPIFARQV